jgi:hypothetical protein
MHTPSTLHAHVDRSLRRPEVFALTPIFTNATTKHDQVPSQAPFFAPDRVQIGALMHAL